MAKRSGNKQHFESAERSSGSSAPTPKSKRVRRSGVALAPKERPRQAPQDTGASATRIRRACACLPSSTTRSMHQSTSTLDAHAHAHARGRASVRQGRASGCRAHAKEEPAPSFRRPRGRSGPTKQAAATSSHAPPGITGGAF